jgi:prophage regulatory protein
MKAFDKNLPETGFIRLSQILKVFPVGRSSFWAGIKTGKYPKPIKLSPRCAVWRVQDIRKLIASYQVKKIKERK